MQLFAAQLLMHKKLMQENVLVVIHADAKIAVAALVDAVYQDVTAMVAVLVECRPEQLKNNRFSRILHLTKKSIETEILNAV